MVQGSASWGGSCEGGKISVHYEDPSWAGIGEGGGASEPQRGTEQQVLGRQNRENSSSGADQNFPAKILFTLAQ